MRIGMQSLALLGLTGLGERQVSSCLIVETRGNLAPVAMNQLPCLSFRTKGETLLRDGAGLA